MRRYQLENASQMTEGTRLPASPIRTLTNEPDGITDMTPGGFPADIHPGTRQAGPEKEGPAATTELGGEKRAIVAIKPSRFARKTS